MALQDQLRQFDVLVVVEMSSPAELGRLTSALLGAEVNINYLSSFFHIQRQH